ncbi:glucan endo-1,3-beta-glucosidase 13-like isoform X2 [Cucurbita pepo subsp. pepo]|uniref:glucan endo-1,3-beta-glucosidase 13-like isoform X2 n=1 Tax=Cucurbita pepo subsp. pepo TaxID=3664 RepID=UPI000C9D3318|nr:glucan endo-1,3-beta-glucosidase 13-like isoform X2 [Cucurbita pepo subsp. pepo]
MRTKIWVLEILLLLQHFFLGEVTAAAAAAGVPVTRTWTPSEGNATGAEGGSWCVAKPGVSQIDLQNALDWACGLGKADCRAIQKGGPCYQPDTLLSHASYAFNRFYKQNANSDMACNFGGSATLTNKDPSYGKCDYSASRSASGEGKKKSGRRLDKICGILVVILNLYLGS